ncbi:MAG: SMC-Scp complex subunit ScpB [Thermodesulfobacteriota bacterium]
MEDLKNIIESLLFVAEEPLTLDRIKDILEVDDRKLVRKTLHELQADYESRTGAFVLREVAGGFQFRSRPEYVPWIKKLIQPKPARLSKAALETLAIIAYKQPVIRSDVEHLRGVDCGGVLRMLMERNLIRVLGRKEIPGRPIIYATTKQFLEVFDLKNLKDLPTPKEIEDLAKAPLDDVTEEEKSPPSEMETDTSEPAEGAESSPGDQAAADESPSDEDSTSEDDNSPPNT